MWIFTPGGLLMPAAIPGPDSKSKADPNFTRDGQFDLQVRARVKSHLTNFMREYMEDGTYNPEIQATPNMDYNFRFYTTREAFAQALSRAVLDIDYGKFKPTAEQGGIDRVTGERFSYGEDGKDYHSVLNSIWSTVLRLGRPGGIWGSYSKDNPRGYKSKGNSPYSRSTGSNVRFFDDDDFEDGSYVGSTFGRRELDYGMDYTPQDDRDAVMDLDMVRGVPKDQWADYLEGNQLANLERFLEENPGFDPEDESPRPKHRKSKAQKRRERRRAANGKRRFKAPF